jgi:Protein of Unknown function (DUF2784)
MYGLLAELIVGIHLLYIAIVMGGLLLIVLGILLRWQWIRNPWFRLVHVIMILIVAFEATISFECPLTTWENQLRAAAGETTEEGSFMGKLMANTLHPEWANEDTLTFGSYGFALLILITFLLAPPRFARKRSAKDTGTQQTMQAAPHLRPSGHSDGNPGRVFEAGGDLATPSGRPGGPAEPT